METRSFGHRRRGFVATALCSTVLIMPAASWAQSEAPSPTADAPPASVAGETDGRVEDIVVTAQRQEQRLQDVPIAVTAVTASTLASVGVEDTARLVQTVPSLTFTRISTAILPRIRGVGNSGTYAGAENSVATYVDGVYISSLAASLLSLNNIARIEVLKGPQGTLFGRNATGGLIQIVTRDPKETFGGNLALGYGNYDTKTASAYMTGGITSGLAVDLAAYTRFQGDGFGRNLFLDRDTNYIRRDVALRSKLLWEVASGIDVRLTADYADRDNPGFAVNQPDGLPPALYTPTHVPYLGAQVVRGGFQDTYTDFFPYQRVKSYGFSGEVRADLGGVTLVSITAARFNQTKTRADLDGGPLPVLHAQNLAGEDKPFSQEVQILSSNSGKLEWVAGMFYFHNVYHTLGYRLGGLVFAPLAATDSRSSGTTGSYAGYGQATYEFLPDTRLTLGVRYTDEKRDAKFVSFGILPSEDIVPLPGGTARAVSDQSAS